MEQDRETGSTELVEAEGGFHEGESEGMSWTDAWGEGIYDRGANWCKCSEVVAGVGCSRTREEKGVHGVERG